MHSLFLITELVEHIVASMAKVERPDPDNLCHCLIQSLTPDAAKDIRSLGLTARLFRDPTLDALWRVQSSLAPLFRSVGAVGPPQTPIIERESWTLRRFLNTDDVPILLQYSSRISALALSNLSPLFPDYLPLLRSLPPTILFPRLSRICCRESGIAEASFVLARMGNSLTSAHMLSKTVIPAGIVSQLRHSPAILRFVQLESAVGGALQDGELTSSEIQNLLRETTSLLNLFLWANANEAMWYAASRLPLKLLLFRASELRPFSSVENTTFQMLTFLRLDIPGFSFLLKIFSKVSFPALRTFLCFFEEYRRGSHAEAAALFAAIDRVCPNATLTELWIERTEYTEDTEHPTDYFIRPDALRPLLRCKNMRSLLLRLEWNWDLDDALMQDMAQAWPDLRELVLDVETPSWPTVPRITFRGLVALAFGCPHLKHFGAGLDTTPLSPSYRTELAQESAATRRVNTNLWDLRIGYSTIREEHVEDIAVFLEDLCSQLRLYGANYDDKWPRVNMRIRDLRGGRESQIQK
ncbi:hypothetical protein EIP91_001842 [Steccherinum ochraceum]|uniref:F-box domain-containing protein n=1 Tax=Steccherinum ochraceum TaxID=92696 RepID=A0A4R0RTZ7_9APHY|nr:hypothetical protein EIP91_001842 [Steccherinum ochraceum]